MSLPILLGLCGVLLVGIGLPLACAVFAFNRLVKARNQQREAWSDIDVQLRKRHDLVPPLVEIVRGYRNHEQAVFESVTAARACAARDPNRTDPAEQNLTAGLRQLFAVAESYPDLKADRNFRKLGEQLASIEDDLQYARRYYNGSVRDFRNLAESFPVILIARLFRFEPGEFFEVDSATERSTPQVEL